LIRARALPRAAAARVPYLEGSVRAPLSMRTFMEMSNTGTASQIDRAGNPASNRVRCSLPGLAEGGPTCRPHRS
jgi:hypothetical protein